MPHSAAIQPPPAPRQRSRLRLSTAQRIGLPILMLIPVLALAGVFGERREAGAAARGALLMHAQVPTRFRYRQRMTLEVSVGNRGPAVVDDVRVRLDSSYLGRFSNVSVTPSPGSDGVVQLGPLAPGESVRIAVTLEGDRSGTHRGAVVATDAAGDTTRLALMSIVFP